MSICEHLNDYKSIHGTNAYRLIHAYFVACPSAEARRRKVTKKLYPPSTEMRSFINYILQKNLPIPTTTESNHLSQKGLIWFYTIKTILLKMLNGWMGSFISVHCCLFNFFLS